MTPPLGLHSLTVVMMMIMLRAAMMLTVVMMTMLMLRAVMMLTVVMMTDQYEACLDDLEVRGLLRAPSVLITRMIL